MKKIITVVVILLTAINLHAREITGSAANKLINGTSKIIINDKTGFPTFIYMSPGKEIPVQYFEKWVRSAFKTTSAFAFKQLQTSVDEKNISHIHYQETWNGVPVQNTMFIAHVQNGKVISCNGWFAPVINAGDDNTLTESSALNFALAYTNANTYRWQSPVFQKLSESEKQNAIAALFPKGELFFASVNGDNKSFKLCYRFDVYAIQPLSRNYVFVDASTGVIVNTIDRIETADATGTAVTGYVGTQTIITDSFAGGYRLREADRGLGIETYNMQTGLDYATAIDFTDADNNWNNVNANLDQYAGDAHYGAEMTYDYYWLNHNRNSIDDAGLKLISYVHYDVGFYNAFWDGAEMTYGDGNGMPLTALDVCGHEISHGVTEHTCGLNYQDEPGGLNEGFSDCMGTSVEFFGYPGNGNWLIGEAFGTPFRSMANPNLYQNPDTYMGQYWVAAGGPDNGGVHTNSGVLNYWFYLMSVGGSGTNDNGYAYNVAGLNIGDASDILYKAWRDYMFSNAQYSDARVSTLSAATDIYGGCSPEVQLVAETWHAVGVGGAFDPTVVADFSVDINAACSAPAIFNFQNLSQNGGSYTWYFGDGTSSSQISPAHTYNALGTYDVKLVVDGGVCGIDSITYPAMIQIDTTLPCVFNMPLTGISTLTSCDGLLYDSGGPGGNYTDNQDVITTIAPTNATGLTLTFTSFSYENNYDYLYIYDGPTTASPLIGQYDNTNLPNGGTITASGNSLTLESTSDQGLTQPGFAASWICSIAIPGVDFTSDFTTTCTGVINFLDQTTNSPTNWLWDFGDGTISTLQDPTHTFVNNGTYSVKLIATNTIGTDSLIQIDYITVDHPSGPTVVNGNNCATGTVILGANGGGGILNWFDSPTGGTQIGTGSSITTPYITSTTTYYVEEAVQSPFIFGGPVDNTIGGGGNYNNGFNDRFEYFDCYQSIKLVSVLVYASGTADRDFQLLDAGGNILLDTIINVPAGTQEVFLNWTLPVGNGLQIGVLATANLYRNSDGANYPYTVPGILSIIGNNANDPVRFYFLYNWKLQSAPCVSTRTAVTANIGNLDATISPNGNISLCGNQNQVLSAVSGASSYLWSNGATTQTVTVSTSGNYSVQVTNGSGCTGFSQVANISFSPVPSSAFTYNSIGFDYGFNCNTAGGASYSWNFGDGGTDNTQNPSHSFVQDGSYIVTLVVCKNNCCDTTTQIIDISTGISDLINIDGWKIFPNPTMNNFNLKYSGTDKIESLTLYNTLGEVVWSTVSSNDKTWIINAEILASGTYFLSAKTVTGNKVFKLEKLN